MPNPDWWRGAVIYQIYPRSFLDTNNDGIGDLSGITQKLEYVADLGVDGIWISPFFKSPMKDFGYDVSDYRDIDPIFGTLNDFKLLLEKAHALNLKIIIDLVLSHTSNEHPWFSDPQKKDWYVWADPTKNSKTVANMPPNNWSSVFGGSAWEWSEEHNQYYLHNFLKEQPDLNFHNPEVQAELLDICKFWLDLGVDGFRLDTVNFYFHDIALRNNPPREKALGYATQFEGDTPYSTQQHIYDKSRPENLEFVSKLRTLTDEYEDRVLIGEIGDDHPFHCAQTYTRGKHRLHTAYNTHMMSGTEKEITEIDIRSPVELFFDYKESVESANAYESWPSWAFSNHDVVRVASRWFKLYDHNPALSKLLIALLGCLPGTAFLYQGEELGLPEAEIPFDQLQDPWAKETWPTWQGRDGCRTPMVWDSHQTFSGFSESEPWLPIPSTHEGLDVHNQEKDFQSILHFTKSFLHWRKNKPSLIKGKFEFINTNNSKIIHIVRKFNNNDTNCIFNLSCNVVTYLTKEYKAYEFKVDELQT